MFDLLYLNGEPLVKEPFLKRRKLLQENFQLVEGQWHFATSLDASSMEEVHEFLDESVKGIASFLTKICFHIYLLNSLK
jgi:DNA ligase-1